jgi:8-oxo-dGTP pyrophosphatase MutT (NUDIX family)
MIDLTTARGEVKQAPSGPFTAEFSDLFSRRGADSLRRDGGPHHVTASCLVIDSAAESVLLNHHRKAGLWGQFGGHLEPEDDSLHAAARREAEEESGLQPLIVTSAPIDLHVHDLSSAFGSCERHFDVVFAASASVRDDLPIVSSESLDVAWFPMGELPKALMPDLPARLPGLFAAAREALG